jgi:hypothetical protein
MSIRVLLIDDESSSVEPVRAELTNSIDGVECVIATFESAASEIKRFQPDVVVLDLMNPTQNGPVNAGSDVGFDVWNHRFCPFIFYTAAPESAPDISHPLVTTISKGSGSEVKVLTQIKAFLPHVAALGKVSNEISDALRRSLRESGARVFEDTTPEQSNELLIRTIRRRVAASMDDAMAAGEPNLKSWEQYLCPPSISHLLTGDILRAKGSNREDPTAYRVVLTPSCDLVAVGERKPKVESVLLAKCKDVSRILTDLGINPKDKSAVGAKSKDKLVSLLTQGYGHSSFPMAQLPGEFPVMAADFRTLEVVALSDAYGDAAKFDRVASVDNPFRELFVWAYLSSAGRPGMPDRDFEPWANEIIAEVNKKLLPVEAKA